MGRLHFGSKKERYDAFEKNKETEGWMVPGFRTDGYSVDFICQWLQWNVLSDKQIQKDLERKAKGLSRLRKDRMKFTQKTENPEKGIHPMSAIKDMSRYSFVGIDPGIDVVMCWTRGEKCKPQ